MTALMFLSVFLERVAWSFGVVVLVNVSLHIEWRSRSWRWKINHGGIGLACLDE